MNIYRKIYEDHFGPIPKDNDGRTYDIHHLDGKHSNNSPENLRALSVQDHYDIHYQQGDWGACVLLANRILILPEEKSRLMQLENTKRIQNGTHNLLGGEVARVSAKQRLTNGTHHFLNSEFQSKVLQIQLEKVKNGTHHLMKKDDGTSVSSNRVENGTHHFLDSEFQRDINLNRVKNGTHHFLGSTMNSKRIHDGSHNFLGKNSPSQVEWACQYCGKQGKGKGNFTKNHGVNCKKK
jgi:hypothetical protein